MNKITALSFEQFKNAKSLKDVFERSICTKCTGTGTYCMGVLNGKPYSNTGFDCWSCQGTGGKYTKRGKKQLDLYKKLQSKKVSDVVIGNEVFMPSIKKWTKITDIKVDESFVYLCSNGYSYGIDKTSDIRVAHSQEENYIFYLEAIK